MSRLFDWLKPLFSVFCPDRTRSQAAIMPLKGLEHHAECPRLSIKESLQNLTAISRLPQTKGQLEDEFTAFRFLHHVDKIRR
jgi:hypothetical protein